MSLSSLLNRSGAGLGWHPQDLGLDQAPPAQEETGLSSRGAQEAGRVHQGRRGVTAPSFS